MILSHTQQQMSSTGNLRLPERMEVVTIAKRMFNEGFKKSTILRITGLSEDEFVGMIRDMQSRQPTLV